jgi:hypothetical protein
LLYILPRKQLVDPVDLVIGDTAEDISRSTRGDAATTAEAKKRTVNHAG